MGGYEFQFSVDKKISVKEVKIIFKDLTDILTELNPEINYVGEIHVLREGLKVERIERSLQIRENPECPFKIDEVKGASNIIYGKKKIPLSETMGKLVQDNMFGGILSFQPDLTITSRYQHYDLDEFLGKIHELNYVKTLGDYLIFDPKKIKLENQMGEPSQN